MLISAISM
uniref:Uncharacterized protein n=1 Tax=Anguilla anguilla TaxID=7936 RepID=A0A0E9VEE3_ANGAN